MGTEKKRERLRLMSFICSFLFFILFVGCHRRKTITQESEFEMWGKIHVGVQISQVVDLLGPPDSIVSDGDEKMLSYQTKAKNNRISNSNLRVDAFFITLTNDVVESTNVGYKRYN